MTHGSIPTVNLVPAPVRYRRHRRRLILRWCGAIVATFFLAGLPGLYIGGNAALSDPLMGAQIDRVRGQLEINQGELPRLRTNISELEDKLRVLDLVRNRIDWRIVFDRIVSASDERVRLSGLMASGGGIEGTDPISIRIDGIATTQTATRAYVVSLESLKLFDRVELQRTSRKEIDDTEIIEFQIFADIGERDLTVGGAP